jgi:hypothetical protein
MHPFEYDRMAASAATDGRALNWDDHVTAIERAYAGLVLSPERAR